MHYLRTHAGQDGKKWAWQTGGRQAEKRAAQCLGDDDDDDVVRCFIEATLKHS